MELKYKPYSYSKLSVYETCPKKFQFQYIDKLPVERKPQVFFDRGKLFHLLMEYDGDLQKIKETKDFKEIVNNKLLDKKQIKEIYKIYKTFINSKEGKSILKHKPLLKEFPLGLDENLEIVPYGDKSVVLRGYIDSAMTVENRDDVMILIDWKSGSKKSKEQQTWRQLLYYSLGLFSKNPYLEKIVLVYAYLEHNHLNIKIVQRKDIQRYKNVLFNKIKRIEEDTEFKKKESELCKYCDYFHVCQD